LPGIEVSALVRGGGVSGSSSGHLVLKWIFRNFAGVRISLISPAGSNDSFEACFGASIPEIFRMT
jgi:hypothetical protein